MAVKIGHSIASARAYCKKSGTSTRVAISAGVAIRASFSKDIFKLF